MPKFLVTAHAEFYCYVKADSPEDAIKLSQQDPNFHRTMNKPLHHYHAEELKKEETSQK